MWFERYGPAAEVGYGVDNYSWIIASVWVTKLSQDLPS